MTKILDQQLAVSSVIHRVAFADGCEGTEKDLQRKVSKQVRLEFGVLFWLQVAWFIIPKLVRLFWRSEDGVKLRKSQMQRLLDRRFAESRDAALTDIGGDE